MRRSGACLMEYVAVLAGERHTDHPKSVCPTLATMARVVNDRVSDRARQRLAIAAPDFIGTAGASVELQMCAGRRVLMTALERARGDQARFQVTVALLSLDRAARRLGIDAATLGEAERARLADAAPAVAGTAWEFVVSCAVGSDEYLRHGLPMGIVTGVQVIGDAAVSCRDDVLVDLLLDTLDYYRGELAPSHREPATAA